MVTRGVPHTIPLPAIIIRILDCQLHSLNVLNKIEWNKLTKVKTLVNVAFHILILQLQNTNLKKISILPFWVVFTIGIKPELQKSCIFVGDKDLCSKKLIFIPGQCHFKTDDNNSSFEQHRHHCQTIFRHTSSIFEFVRCQIHEEGATL